MVEDCGTLATPRCDVAQRVERRAQLYILGFSCQLPGPVTIRVLFEQVSQGDPGVAQVFADPADPLSWTNRELAAALRAAAGKLVERGGGEGFILGLIADRQLEVVAAYP